MEVFAEKYLKIFHTDGEGHPSRPQPPTREAEPPARVGSWYIQTEGPWGVVWKDLQLHTGTEHGQRVPGRGRGLSKVTQEEADNWTFKSCFLGLHTSLQPGLITAQPRPHTSALVLGTKGQHHVSSSLGQDPIVPDKEG